MAADPPPGFAVAFRAPYVNHVGPIHQEIKTTPGRMRLGLLVAEVHTNSLGFMHGGMAATLVDSCMARALHAALQRRAVTLKMSIEYLDTLNLGDWVEAHGWMVSHDDDIALTRCELRVGDAVRANGSGVFRLLRRR